jgi:hypothetical protein
MAVQVKGGVLYRPPQAVPPSPKAVTEIVHPSPSLELTRHADWVLSWGVLSIVLGWTVVVPLIGVCAYIDASSMAKKEQMPVPVKATISLVLCLLFGAAQSLWIFAYLLK